MPHSHHAEDMQAVPSSTILLPLLLSYSLSNAVLRNKNILNVLLHDITDSVHAQDLPVIHLHVHRIKLFPGKCVHHTHIFPTPFSSHPKREPSLSSGREDSLYLFMHYHNFCYKSTDFRKRSDCKKIFDCFHIYEYSFFHS